MLWLPLLMPGIKESTDDIGLIVIQQQRCRWTIYGTQGMGHPILDRLQQRNVKQGRKVRGTVGRRLLLDYTEWANVPGCQFATWEVAVPSRYPNSLTGSKNGLQAAMMVRLVFLPPRTIHSRAGESVAIPYNYFGTSNPLPGQHWSRCPSVTRVTDILKHSWKGTGYCQAEDVNTTHTLLMVGSGPSEREGLHTEAGGSSSFLSCSLSSCH